MFVQISLGLDSPSLVIRILPYPWYREYAFRMGVLSPAFRKKKEGQSALLASAIFQGL